MICLVLDWWYCDVLGVCSPAVMFDMVPPTLQYALEHCVMQPAAEPVETWRPLP